MLLSAALVAAMVTSDASAQGRNPGSVLFYPIHRSGPSYFTVVSVTNSDLKPKTLTSFGGSTNVHFQYVNSSCNPGGNPFRPATCVIFDRIEFLTPADTLSVLTACHNAYTPGGQEGYLFIDAEDPSCYLTPWSHNFLLGSELVVNGQGAAYQLNAVPFKSPIAHHCPTDKDCDGALDFDGCEYSEIPDVLYIDSFLGLATSQLTLTNLTGLPEDINTLYLSVWNDNEFALSATLDFNCWFDQPLPVVSPLFAESFLRSLQNDPAELDINCDGRGDLETGWACIQSCNVRTPGGESFSHDGAVLGAISTGPLTAIQGGKLLWESCETQKNGSFGCAPQSRRIRRP
jgi:hypothetical protein